MKKIITIALIMLNSFIGLCQETKLMITKYRDSEQIMEKFYVLKSDGKTKHGEYLFYDKAPENDYKKYKNDTSRLKYLIKIIGNYDNGKKSGHWVQTGSEGDYLNGKKVGVWIINCIEDGQVSERFDYDNNKKLEPFILVRLHYPKKSLENGIQGSVTVAYNEHSDCTITDIHIEKSLSEDCDAEAIKAIIKTGEFLKKYGVNCEEKAEHSELKFKLN